MAARIDFFYFDAGGGHRAAATALKTVIERQRRPWDVRLFNLQELLDQLDVIRQTTGIRVQDGYNLLLEKGFTLGMGPMLTVLHGLIRLSHSKQVKMLEEFWKAGAPDMAVSLIPNFNRALRQALKTAAPEAPFITILTDFADYPPHFWIERQEQYLICGTERAVQQAIEIGNPPERVLRVSGMILRPHFYEPVTEDRRAARESLGLQPDTPTGLVLFGGQGSPVMVDIVRRLGEIDQDLQLVLLCGKNEKLGARLRAMKTRIPIHVEGFTREVPRFMHLSDFLIGKPGPGAISEAIQMNLPIILERNMWTMPQERFNTDWVRDKDVGLVLDSFRRIGAAVGSMLAGKDLERYRANARGIENRAVFEIPDILAGLMP